MKRRIVDLESQLAKANEESDWLRDEEGKRNAELAAANDRFDKLAAAARHSLNQTAMALEERDASRAAYVALQTKCAANQCGVCEKHLAAGVSGS